MKWLMFAVALLFLVGCSQSENNATPEQVKRQIENGNNALAIVNAKALLQKGVDDQNAAVVIQARVLLANAYYSQGHYAQSTSQYNWILDKVSSPANQDGFDWFKVVVSYIESYAYPELQLLLEHEQAPFTLSEAFVLRIANKLADNSGALFDVVSELRRVRCNECHPLIQAIYLGQLSSFGLLSDEVWQNQSTELAKHIDDYQYVAMALGRHYQNTKQYAQAKDYLVQYTSARPEDLHAKLVLASVELALGNDEQATALTNALLAQTQKAPMVLQLQGVLAFKRGDMLEAAAASQTSISLGLESVLNLIIAGLSNSQLGNMELGANYLGRIKNELPVDHPLMVIVTNITETIGNKGTLDSTSAIELALSESSRISSQRLQRADASNNAELAQVAGAQGTSSRFERIGEALSNGDIDTVKQELVSWEQEEGRTVDWLNTAAIVAINDGDIAGSQALLNEAKQLDPNNIPSLMQDIQQAQQEQKWLQVIAITEPMLMERSISIPSVIVAWLEAHIRRRSLPLEQVEHLNTLMGDEFERIFVGHLLRLNEVNTLGEYLYNIIGEANWHSGHFNAALLLNQNVGRVQEVSRLTKAFVDSGKAITPTDLMLALSISEKMGDINAVVGLLDYADTNNIAIEGKAYFQATVYLAQQKWEDAKQALLSENLNTPKYYNMLARAHYELDEVEPTRNALINSLNLRPNLITLDRLFELEQNQAEPDLEQFADAVTNTIEFIPYANDVRLRISQWVLLVKPELSAALLESPSMTQLVNADPVLLNNLAWAQLQTNELEKATVTIEKALALAPEDPSFLDTQASIEEKLREGS